MTAATAAVGSAAVYASLLTSLGLFAAMMVPSELIRSFGSKSLRRRIFEPRLERLRWASAVPDVPRWPFAELWVAWRVDDREQRVVDGV